MTSSLSEGRQRRAGALELDLVTEGNDVLKKVSSSLVSSARAIRLVAGECGGAARLLVAVAGKAMRRRGKMSQLSGATFREAGPERCCQRGTGMGCSKQSTEGDRRRRRQIASRLDQRRTARTEAGWEAKQCRARVARATGSNSGNKKGTRRSAARPRSQGNSSEKSWDSVCDHVSLALWETCQAWWSKRRALA